MTAYLPVVRREGSRPLLAALRPTATIPPASLSYKCARAARTPYLLFIIYYLLSILPPPSSRCSRTIPRGLSRALKTPHWGVFAPRYAERGVSTCGYRIERRPLTWLVLCDRCACFGFLFPPQAAVTSAASCSRPRWCTCPQYLGKSQQKNSPTFPVNLYLPFISPGTLPRPKNAPPGRFCPAVR